MGSLLDDYIPYHRFTITYKNWLAIIKGNGKELPGRGKASVMHMALLNAP
jgi:hypothetical protein